MSAATEPASIWPASGVHRVLAPAALVADELRGRGWRVALVPPAGTGHELWDGLSAALGLPDWFGRNLDALDESLRDLDAPTAVVLASWWTYARARPERWRRLLGLLSERADHADRDPAFLVVLAD